MNIKKLMTIGVFIVALLGNVQINTAIEELVGFAYADMYQHGNLIGEKLFPKLAENYQKFHHRMYNEQQIEAYHHGAAHGILALVSTDAEMGLKGHWGLIDIQGNYIMQPESYDLIAFSGDKRKIFAKKDGEGLEFDLNGNLLRKQSKAEIQAVERETDKEYKKKGYLPMPETDFMDPYMLQNMTRSTIFFNGKMVYPWADFGQMVDLKEGLAFINTNGDFIIGPGAFRVAGNNEVDVETGLIALLDIHTGKVGVFSMNDGTPVVPMEYDSVTFCGGARLLIERQDVAILVDQTTGIVLSELPRGNQSYLPASMGQISTFLGGIYFGLEEVSWLNTFYDYDKGDFMNTEKLQIIDRNGKVRAIIDDMSVDSIVATIAIGGFKNGFAPIKKKGKWGIIDSYGHWITPPIYKSMQMA